MPTPLFQLACVGVLAFAYGWLLFKASPAQRKSLALTIVTIAIAAWAAEETSILRYRFYGYPDTWVPKIDEMPLLVAFIWPMVILSSRSIVEVLFPNLSIVRKTCAVGVAVVIDATLVETVAVASGLWGWVEGGYLGAPLIGMLGWGAFAAAMTYSLEHPKIPLWLTPLTALAGTHLLLVILWWAFFRHALRGELPTWSVYIGVAAILALAAWLRSRGRLIPILLTVPRVAATSVFVALLILHASFELALHFAAIAVLYLALLDFRRPTAE
jgi:hypothetical protein